MTSFILLSNILPIKFIILTIFLSLILPFTYMILGYIFWKNPPKSINSICGYRTTRAMKNQETWTFANQFAGRTFLRLGVVCTLISLIAIIIIAQLNENIFGISIVILVLLQTVSIAYVINKTEQELKKKFE